MPTYMAELVGRDRDVLEIRPGPDGVARPLEQLGCRVTTWENAGGTGEVPPEASFDVLVLPDSLGRSADPLGDLRRLRPLLRPGGEVVLSARNVAHGDVRLALLDGRFEYSPDGLLGADQLRFFTRRSLRELLRGAGLVPLEERAVRRRMFSTEVPVEPAAYDPAVVEQISADDDSTTYEFVVRAVPADEHEELARVLERAERAEAAAAAADAERRELARRVDDLLDEVGRLRVSETEARLHLNLLADRMKDFEGASKAVQRMSRAVRWTRPLRHRLRRITGRTPPEPLDPDALR